MNEDYITPCPACKTTDWLYVRLLADVEGWTIMPTYKDFQRSKIPPGGLKHLLNVRGEIRSLEYYYICSECGCMVTAGGIRQ